MLPFCQTVQFIPLYPFVDIFSSPADHGMRAFVGWIDLRLLFHAVNGVGIWKYPEKDS